MKVKSFSFEISAKDWSKEAFDRFFTQFFGLLKSEKARFEACSTNSDAK